MGLNGRSCLFTGTASGSSLGYTLPSALPDLLLDLVDGVLQFLGETGESLSSGKSGAINTNTNVSPPLLSDQTAGRGGTPRGPLRSGPWRRGLCPCESGL